MGLLAAPAAAQTPTWAEPWRRADWKWLVPKAASSEQTARVTARYAAGQAWIDGAGAEQVPAILAQMRAFLAAGDDAARSAAVQPIEAAGAPFAALELLALRLRGATPQAAGPAEEPFVIAADGSPSKLYLDFPKGYAPAGHAWPLLLTLHGSGEPPDNRRDRLARVLHERGWIVAAPLSTPNQMKGWGSREIERNVVVSALATLLRRHNIDPDRVVLHGFSMGANGTWETGMLHRDRFAGLVPNSGGPRYRCFPFLGNLAGLPIRATVGGDENALLRQAVAEAVAFLGGQLKGPVVHTVAPGVGHDEPPAWHAAMLEWLPGLRRDVYPRALLHHFVTVANGRCHWVRAVVVGPKVLDATTGRIPVRADPDPDKMRANYVAAGRKGVARLVARVDGQTIEIQTRHVPRFTCYFSDRCCDLDQKVFVKVNGRTAWSGIVKRDLRQMLTEIAVTGDAGRVYAASREFRGR